MPIDSNSYVIISKNKALIIDPNTNGEAFDLVSTNRCDEISIILTHEHIDHISGVNVYRKYATDCGGLCTVYANKKCADAITDSKTNLSRHFSVLFMMHSDEERCLASRLFDSDYICNADVIFDNEMELAWEGLRFNLKSAPGHSPGSICIEVHNHNGVLEAVFTGDSLILHRKVITRLPRGSKSDYLEKTKPYLHKLPLETMVLPGHGAVAYMRDFEID